jgi:integrase/recombinase XerD
VVALGRPHDPAAPRGGGWCPAPHRPAPAPPRARRRDGSRSVPLNVIQRQLGHANLGITSIYLQGIDNSEIINTVHARPAPMLPASAGLR